MDPNHASPAVTSPRLLQPLALLSLLACAACGETVYPASTPAVVFPTRAEIARIPAKAPLATVFGTEDVPVDEWTVESPPMPAEGAYDDPSPWGALLRDLTKTRAATVSLSPAMRCAAAEIGRFHLKNHALPVESLRRFILARCGGETPSLAPFVWFIDAPAGVSDGQIIARARDALANAIEEPLAHGHHLVGLAATRDAKRATVVLAIGEDEARLEPGSRSVDASRHVVLRGTARGDYAHIVALVNRGEYGVSRCENDLRVRPPAFSLSCELGAGDAFDWVQILGEKRGRVMLHALAESLIYEGDPKAIGYKVKHYGDAAPVTSLAGFTSVLVDRLNAVRAAARMPGLTLAAKQSAENERLAGTILDAAVARDDDSADKAAIGLLAGWDVEGGTIRDGQFFLSAVAPTRDAMAWLDSAVERPIGRLTLLDPESRMIAVGPSIPGGAPGLAAAVTTYSMFGSEDHAADEALFFRRIAAARAARGLAAPVRIQTSKDLQQAAARVLREEVTPQGALNDMLTTAAWQNGATAYGYVLETNDLARVEIPEVFLKQGPLPMVLAITHHRAPGAAWGQYVVFTLLSGGAPTPTVQATRGEPGRGVKGARVAGR